MGCRLPCSGRLSPDDVSASSADLLRFRHSQPRALAKGMACRQQGLLLASPRTQRPRRRWYVPGQTPNAGKCSSTFIEMSGNTHAAKSRPVVVMELSKTHVS